jgi:hypothetical protein
LYFCFDFFPRKNKNFKKKREKKRKMSLSKLCEEKNKSIEKSKLENGLVIEKMGIKNPQSNFPLLPIFSSKADILTSKMDNIGLIPYLSKVDTTNNITGTVSSNITGAAGSLINEIGSGTPFSYTITNIGKQIDNREVSYTPGKNIEIREITILPEPPHFYYSSSDDDDDQKQQEKITINEKKILSQILHIPIVSDLAWKKLSILILKKCATKLNLILEQLLVPTKELNSDVLTILKENKEMLELFNFIRKDLNNINNGAYVQSFIHGILSFISVNNLTPSFQQLFGNGRGQEMSSITKNDLNIPPMWKEYIFLQYTDNYYADILAMHSFIDLEMLMADLFQIVFGLDFAQRKVGFIHGNFDVRKAIGYTKIDPCTLLQFKWDDDYYHIPTNGKMIKIIGLENSSVTINNVQHSSAANNSIDNNFNTDLVRLGATLRRVIQEKQDKVVSNHPEICSTFDKMIDKWVNCGNPSDERKLSSSKYKPTTKEIEMQNYRLKCLQSDDENGQCGWKKFGSVPSHTECTSAIPSKQKDFFKMFLVDKSKINNDALLYILGGQAPL